MRASGLPALADKNARSTKQAGIPVLPSKLTAAVPAWAETEVMA
jgi:hypothetical protein